MATSNTDSDNPNLGNKSASGGNETTKQKVEEEARKVKYEAGAEAREQAEAGQHRVADEASAVSEAIDAAASQLDKQDREGLARYAREMSRNLAKAAGQLENRSVEELSNDAKRLARDNPALFMAGSIAIGFGLSRFFKASTEHSNEDRDNTSTATPMHGHEPGLTAANKVSPDRQTQDGRPTL